MKHRDCGGRLTGTGAANRVYVGDPGLRHTRVGTLALPTEEGKGQITIPRVSRPRPQLSTIATQLLSRAIRYDVGFPYEWGLKSV